MRIPTDEDFAAYHGEHCFDIWRRTPRDWTCHGCGRSKREIMRWTKRAARPRAGYPKLFLGWMAGLHVHHDHAADRDGFYRPELARFAESVVCDQCNAADGIAKRRLCLPKRFSFSPAELRQFVDAVPHASHRLNLDVALRIFKQVYVNGSNTHEVHELQFPL
jgi:hypothetical protein